MWLKADKLVEDGLKDRINDTEKVQIKEFVHVFEAIAINCFIKGQCFFRWVFIALFTEVGDKWDDDGNKRIQWDDGGKGEKSWEYDIGENFREK